MTEFTVMLSAKKQAKADLQLSYLSLSLKEKTQKIFSISIFTYIMYFQSLFSSPSWLMMLLNKKKLKSTTYHMKQIYFGYNMLLKRVWFWKKRPTLISLYPYYLPIASPLSPHCRGYGSISEQTCNTFTLKCLVSSLLKIVYYNWF